MEKMSDGNLVCKYYNKSKKEQAVIVDVTKETVTFCSKYDADQKDFLKQNEVNSDGIGIGGLPITRMNLDRLIKIKNNNKELGEFSFINKIIESGWSAIGKGR
jgi:hypothetical protein